MLQGPSSRFFTHLGRALRARGADVLRVGFAPGDRLMWTHDAGRYLPYRGHPDAFGEWFNDLLLAERPSDLLMLGDGRPVHAAALQVAQSHPTPLAAWIVEHGYLRPDLIVIEPWGMGGGSRIPAAYDPGARIPQPPENPRFPASFLRYAALDIAWHLSTLALGWARYPHYRPHSGLSPLVEYAGWIGKALARPARLRARRVALGRIEQAAGPLFLFPLQLRADFQLRRYGTGEDLIVILERVLEDFARHAPRTARLIVKVHPLDNGRTDWRRLIGARAIYLDGGDPGALWPRLSGVVTVNSTVGLAALQAGVPTHVLGAAIYDRAGMTDPGPLARFWQDPEPPTPGAVAHFSAFLRAHFHVSGAFDGPGAPAGAKALADWLAQPPDAALKAAA